MNTKNIFKSAALGLFLTAFGLTAHAQIVVGIAYAPMDGKCKQFKQAIGYDIQKYSDNISDMSADVRSNLKRTYYVGESDIMIFSSYNKSDVIILEYSKPISGYNCVKHGYAAGFGNNYDEAYNAAVREMRLYYSGDNYKLFQHQYRNY